MFKIRVGPVDKFKDGPAVRFRVEPAVKFKNVGPVVKTGQIQDDPM
jgi:hypothetical protein